MTTGRNQHTMTLQGNGQVLIAGGETCSSATSCTALNSAELYNPIAGTFAATGSLNAARFNASASILDSGQVLVAGGFDGTNYPAAAELYNPVTATFTTTGSLNTTRAGATASLLDNGQVMIAGGSTCSSPGCPTAITELFSSSYFYYPTYPSGNMPFRALMRPRRFSLTDRFSSLEDMTLARQTARRMQPRRFSIRSIHIYVQPSSIDWTFGPHSHNVD